jgi:hypothetical protein
VTDPPRDLPDPLDDARRDLERARHLGDELLAGLLVVGVLLVVLAVVWTVQSP